MKLIPDIAGYRQAAKKMMKQEVWDYLVGGAFEETSVGAKGAGFGELTLIPRILSGVVDVNLSTTILGMNVDAPLMLGPISPLQIFHGDAEKVQLGGAADEGVIAVMSNNALMDISEADRFKGGAKNWFQLYAAVDWAHIERVVSAVNAASTFSALVVTVDAFHGAVRRRDRRNQFRFPPEVNYAVFNGLGEASRRFDGSYKLMSLNWDDLERLKKLSELPIVLKGVLHPDDAVKAEEYGVSGIIVSNHGGRQLDRTVSSLRALSMIREKVSDGVELYLDGGVENGWT